MLYGAEPTPFHGLDVHSLNSELAAIIVKVPEEMPESCDSLLHTSNFNDSGEDRRLQGDRAVVTQIYALSTSKWNSWFVN